MIKPKSDKYHLLLYDGRYDGDDPKWFKKEIRQSAPYVNIKNIDIISATELTLPNETKAIAIIRVIMELFIGSLSLFLP